MGLAERKQTPADTPLTLALALTPRSFIFVKIQNANPNYRNLNAKSEYPKSLTPASIGELVVDFSSRKGSIMTVK